MCSEQGTQQSDHFCPFWTALCCVLRHSTRQSDQSLPCALLHGTRQRFKFCRVLPDRHMAKLHPARHHRPPLSVAFFFALCRRKHQAHGKVRFAVPWVAVLALPWAAASKCFAVRYMVFAVCTRHMVNYPILVVYICTRNI